MTTKKLTKSAHKNLIVLHTKGAIREAYAVLAVRTDPEWGEITLAAAKYLEKKGLVSSRRHGNGKTATVWCWLTDQGARVAANIAARSS